MQSIETEELPKKKPSRKRLLWVVLLVLFLGLCGGSATLTVVADQTTLLGVAYIQSVHAGNTWLADLMGDHFSDDKSWHQKFYAQDIKRDTTGLYNVELSDVNATREQTLSGQWVTMVRYKWREKGSTGDWNDAALRVKTDHWLFFPYIRAVEPAEP